MRHLVLRGLLVAAGLSAMSVAPATAIEIATGTMLGPRYKPDRFYVRSSPGSAWSLTYEGGTYRRKVRGSLALVRVTQALFDDEWLHEKEFDPDANTDRVIELLDLYKSHGVGGIVVGLQGGDPGYSPEENGVARGASADLGSKSGALVSAYDSTGSLKPAWTARLDKLLKAADSRGMVVCLVLFQQDQDEALATPDSILRAAANIGRHLVELDARNVIIDVADAWDRPESNWDHRQFVPRFVEQLIRTVRDQFQHADFTLPIGASSISGRSYPQSLAQLCDLVLVQGNGHAMADKIRRSKDAKTYGRPLLMIGDSIGVEATFKELEEERTIALAYIERASGWSYAPSRMANCFPFVYRPPESAELDEAWPATQRHPAYYRAMLEEIAAIMLRRPPSTKVKRRR